MTLTANPAKIDVRGMPPRDRHPLIFSTFHSLGAGQSMEIVNDHDPKPLYYQFQAEMPGRFSWDYLEQGPDTWHVRVTKLGQPKSNAQCCGSCGGV